MGEDDWLEAAYEDRFEIEMPDWDEPAEIEMGVDEDDED